MTIHVYPLNDLIEHDIDSDAADCECPCNPRIDWIDEDTGLPLNEPVIVHNAIDGRK